SARREARDRSPEPESDAPAPPTPKALRAKFIQDAVRVSRSFGSARASLRRFSAAVMLHTWRGRHGNISHKLARLILAMRNNVQDQRERTSLVRALGPVDATMIVIGSMIGSGIFIVSAESSRLSGAPGWLLLAWAFAGLLTITGALCCSELATMMPRAGGVYVFLREAYGKSIGFLYGWTLFLVIQTGTIAAVAIAFAKFLGVFVPAVSPENYLVPPISLGHYAISLSTEQLVAICLIALLTWMNTRGLEVGKIVQNTFTFAKTAALAAVVVVGLSLGWNANSAARTSAWWDSWANGWSPETVQPGFTFVGGVALALLFGKSMVGPLFAQTAWTNVTFIGSEIRDPGKNLVRALVIGCGTVVILYVLANLAYVAVLPFSGIQH